MYTRHRHTITQIAMGFATRLTASILRVRSDFDRRFTDYYSNLFFFLNKANNIDPDIITSTSATAAGFDSFGPPTARSFGLNLNLGF